MNEWGLDGGGGHTKQEEDKKKISNNCITLHFVYVL